MQFTAFLWLSGKKHCKYRWFLMRLGLKNDRKIDQKPGKILSERVFEAFGGFKIAQNYGIYTVLCTFPAENDGIYMVFCAFPAHNRGAPLDRRL